MPHVSPSEAPNNPSEISDTTLLIEGWRGVNHSFAMVNQHQILELLKIERLSVLHRDMPFAFGHWDRRIHKAGFTPDQERLIGEIPEPNGNQVDSIYRIVSPFRAPDRVPRCRQLTFMITELGLSDASFAPGSKGSDRFTAEDNLIVTSTRWSRERIVEGGFDPTRVVVIPLGVDAEVFRPLDAQERSEVRSRLAIREDETLFLNIGVSVWNKGIDILLTAFARLRAGGRRVRLLLKDQRDVYGISVEQMIRGLGDTIPELRLADTLGAISVIPGNLDRTQLRQLYGVADCYVSPYRAEGFNMPVIEALACGTPVIVTAGGATDDFCDDRLACRIAGWHGTHGGTEANYVGRFIEPRVDDVFSAMDGFVAGEGLDRARFEAARASMLRSFTWARPAGALAALAKGEDRAGVAGAVQAAWSILPEPCQAVPA
jgi:glycosyltransferase involved in cell wall biosynthesis